MGFLPLIIIDTDGVTLADLGATASFVLGLGLRLAAAATVRSFLAALLLWLAPALRFLAPDAPLAKRFLADFLRLLDAPDALAEAEERRVDELTAGAGAAGAVARASRTPSDAPTEMTPMSWW
ncbi:hypothetical protein V7S43_016291 [Phytophthora oleae]|uniref:Uncharacterized protein n=1 Tax=Phytophthora oleae TaxID=2107226 RepID=A0ABD3EXK2_9STRA